MNIFKKLQDARIRLQNTEIKKTGHNKFANYYYLTLDDFLPTVQQIFAEVGLCGVVSYTESLATLVIVDTDSDSDASIVITSPMGSAALKGCHEVQNVGAVETYQRRYLWVTAMEIVEHDVLDAGTKEDKFSEYIPPKTIKPRLPKLTDAEAEVAYNDWQAVKAALLAAEEDGIVDPSVVSVEWFKRESNVRSAIGVWGNKLKDAAAA